MMTLMWHRPPSLILYVLLILVFCGNGSAQIPPASPTPSPSPENARPLYGVQGVLIETLDGKVVSAQSET
jgi:hypothetical protein